jgi:hypothetical protein
MGHSLSDRDSKDNDKFPESVEHLPEQNVAAQGFAATDQ